MPDLDASDILLDPDFCDYSLTCSRNVATVGENGVASLTSTVIDFAGVVTQIETQDLTRLPDGERITGRILICTPFRLRSGDAAYTADVVTWLGNQYTVIAIENYSTFGRGFIEATCELIPLTG